MHPRVSLLIPSYNYGRFISQALDGLLGQTLTDLELIVIDDASRDDTQAVLAKYSAEPRIRLVRHEQNRGHLNSYNEGLALARGEYVGIVSADDYCVRSDALERQVGLFERHANVGMVYSAHLMVDPDGGETTVAHGEEDQVRPGFREFRSLIWGNYILHSGTLLRAEVQAELGSYDLALPHSGDWDFWLRAAARHQVGYIAQPLYAYRLHRSNMQSTGIPPGQQADQNVRTLQKAFAALPLDAPSDLWDLREAAMKHALLQTAWFDLRNGRVRRGWAGVRYAVRRQPGILGSGELWRYVSRLTALSLLGRSRYLRLDAAMSRGA